MPDPGTPFIHPTATVEQGAVIGLRTKIWHYGHVRAEAIIGADCVLGKGVFVDSGAVIGDRCKVQNNVSVYNGVTLEDDVFVGPSAVFTNDLYPRATSQHWEIVPTTIRRGSSISANATIVCGVVIGEWATVAAGALVTRDVEDHQLVMGQPARPAGWVCTCGRVVTREIPRPATMSCGKCTEQVAS